MIYDLRQDKFLLLFFRKKGGIYFNNIEYSNIGVIVYSKRLHILLKQEVK